MRTEGGKSRTTLEQHKTLMNLQRSSDDEDIRTKNERTMSGEGNHHALLALRKRGRRWQHLYTAAKYHSFALFYDLL